MGTVEAEAARLCQWNFPAPHDGVLGWQFLILSLMAGLPKEETQGHVQHGVAPRTSTCGRKKIRKKGWKKEGEREGKWEEGRREARKKAAHGWE